MKRRLILILLAVLMSSSICFAVTSCKHGLIPVPPNHYRGDYPALYSVLVCSVPGTGNSRQRLWSLDVLETDTYGRVLFKSQQFTGFYSDNELFAYVVCQHYDDDGAFYLRDVNFELADPKDNIEANRIEDLKNRNCWEQPLDLEADGVNYTPAFTYMRFYNSELDNGHYTNSTRLERELESSLLAKYSAELFGEKWLKVHCFDVYDDGKAIYIVEVSPDSQPHYRDESVDKTCLVATYADGTIFKGSPLWIDDPYSEEYYKQLVQFRADFEEAAALRAGNSGS